MQNPQNQWQVTKVQFCNETIPYSPKFAEMRNQQNQWQSDTAL